MKPIRIAVLLLCASTPAVAGLDVFTPGDVNPANGYYRNDVQASYPQVNWQTLDVLCLPAGHYKFIRLGNLPVRTADDPLRITNCGGQVRVGGLGHYYLFSIGGGANWILTGEHDPARGTGDAAFAGHAGGDYAHSRGRYGILVDDENLDSGLSGLAVGGGATDFEIAFVEIRRVGFAGLLMKTDDDGAATMANVRVHDTYIHDVGSEGVYIGSTQAQPQHRISGLSFYNNRLVRTGTEMFQIGQAGGDTDIHHNVFFLGAMDWKNPFQPYQDNATQHSPREGTYRFRNNIVIGGTGSLAIVLGADVAGDTQPAGSRVEITDNYFSHGRNFGMYVARFTDDVRTVHLSRNRFRRLDFQYDEIDPGATDPDRVISFGSGGAANTNPVVVADNRYDGPQDLIGGWSDPNQTIGNISGSGNLREAVPDLVFVDSGFPSDFDYLRFEIWTSEDIDGDPVSYITGDIASVHGALYRCDVGGGCGPQQFPPDTPAAWTPLPDPPDDLRLASTSPIRGVGLLDNATVVEVFADGFENDAMSSFMKVNQSAAFGIVDDAR